MKLFNIIKNILHRFPEVHRLLTYKTQTRTDSDLYNVTLISQHGIIKHNTPDGVVYDAAKVYGNRLILRPYLLKRKPKQIYHGHAIYGCGMYTPTWYHWIWDVCLNWSPLLGREPTNSKVPMIVPKTAFDKPYYIDALRLFGITNPVMPHEGGSMEVGHLEVHRDAVPFKWEVFEPLRKALNLTDKPIKGGWIFLNRKPTERRTLVNSEEIKHLIESYGYEEVFIEDYSVEDQIGLINSAEKIIILHGSSMAMFWALSKNANVIEIASFYNYTDIVRRCCQMTDSSCMTVNVEHTMKGYWLNPDALEYILKTYGGLE